MADVGEQPAPGVVGCLQRRVGRLQLRRPLCHGPLQVVTCRRQGIAVELQLGRHLVEVSRELGELVMPAHGDPVREIPLRKPLGAGDQGSERLAQAGGKATQNSSRDEERGGTETDREPLRGAGHLRRRRVGRHHLRHLAGDRPADQPVEIFVDALLQRAVEDALGFVLPPAGDQPLHQLEFPHHVEDMLLEFREGLQFGLLVQQFLFIRDRRHLLGEDRGSLSW